MKALSLIIGLLFVGVSADARADSCPLVTEFAGTVIVGTFAPGAVALQWTAFEDGTVREYRISRYAPDCGGSGCVRRVAKLRANQAQRTTQRYDLTDTVTAGIWRYRLTVVRSGGQTCSVESGDVLVVAPSACDTGALCAQVESSFAGTVIIGTVVPSVSLEWLTQAETGAVSGYRLSRSNCRNPRTCSTEVAVVDAIGDCGTVQLHRLTDELPAGDWTYRLEVLDPSERTACSFALRLPGPASPASSR